MKILNGLQVNGQELFYLKSIQDFILRAFDDVLEHHLSLRYANLFLSLKSLSIFILNLPCRNRNEGKKLSQQPLLNKVLFLIKCCFSLNQFHSLETLESQSVSIQITGNHSVNLVTQYGLVCILHTDLYFTDQTILRTGLCSNQS